MHCNQQPLTLQITCVFLALTTVFGFAVPVLSTGSLEYVFDKEAHPCDPFCLWALWRAGGAASPFAGHVQKHMAAHRSQVGHGFMQRCDLGCKDVPHTSQKQPRDSQLSCISNANEPVAVKWPGTNRAPIGQTKTRRCWGLFFFFLLFFMEILGFILLQNG